MMCSREVFGVLLCLALTAAAGASPAGLTIIDDVKSGVTPIDTLVSVRERIRTAQAGDPMRKVLVDADFGPALNAELVKFDNAHTVFWRGSATREEAIARVESAVVLPRAAIGVPRPRDADYWWQALKGHEYARSRLPETVDLVMVGDSITAGWSGAASGEWIGRLRADYAIHNLGIGSDRCENILWRMENGELDGYRAKAVMVLAGTNNLDEPVEDVIASVSRLVATVKDRQPRAKVILVSVFPRYESATHPFRAWAKALDAGIRPLADGERVRWLDFGDRFLAADGTLPKAMFPDGTHPNADGYAIWYEELSRVLAEQIPEGGSARQKAIPTAKCETEIVRRLSSLPPRTKPDEAVGRPDWGAHLGFGWWVDQLAANRQAIRNLKDGVCDTVILGSYPVFDWRGAGIGLKGSSLPLGILEDRIGNVLWRARNGELDGYRAKRVVILTGERHVGEEPEDVVRGIGAVVKEAKARQPGAQIVVLGILPYGGPHASAASTPNVWRRKVNVALLTMAKDADVSFLDVSPDFRLPNGDTDPEMMPSDVHPSKKGFAALERRLASVGGPARDYAADPAFVAKFREGAIAIAKRKMAEVDEGVRTHPTVVPTGRRLATGGQFGGFFLWDSAFSVLWARYLDEKEFPVHSTLDNFYALATPSGFIPREYTPEGNPCWTEVHPISFSAPLLSWAELELFRMGKSDKARLARVYPFLKRHHEACRRSFRRDDGLYFGDQIGCGMDDLVRWPKDLKPGEKASGGIAFTKAALGAKVQDWWTWLEEKKDDLSWNRQAGWIDLSCEVAFDCLNLAELAETIGRTDDAAAFRAEHASLVRVINEKCWDESRGFYFDVTDGGIVDRYMGCAYWALISKVATPARAKRMVEKLFDPRFFGRPVMVPSLAACEPDYDPEKGYWRGACWPPTTYMTILGLKSYGYVKEAEQVARRFYNANAELFVRTGTIWEDISAEQSHEAKSRACRDFCGWSALAPIALPIEWNWTI